MNKYENGVIKYQIDFESYKNGQANEIINLLDNANKALSKYIKQTSGIYTKERYKELNKILRDISSKLKTDVDEHTDIDGLINYELKKEKKLLSLAKQYIKDPKKEVAFQFPTLEQIRTSALFKPVTDGFTYDSYLNGIEAGLYNVWDSALRTGYLTGQTTADIVRDVMGSISQTTKLKNPALIDSLRNSIYGNTKTLLQSFAEETREQVYRENEQYFGDGESEYKYEYLATLDSHTCLVCADASSKLYKSLEDCPHVPQHRGCRCVILPYFNIEGDKKASKNGYVDADLTFSKWLQDQDEETQKDVLGVTRYKIFHNNPELIKSFVDNGKVLTLPQLYEKLDIPNTVAREGETDSSQKLILAKDISERRKEIKINRKMSFSEREKQIKNWLLENGEKTNLEYRIITDSNNKVLLILEGETNNVGYSLSPRENDIFYKYKVDTLHCYHNHPNGTAPSIDDIFDCAKTIQYKDYVVYSYTGTKYRLASGDLRNHLDKDSKEFFEKVKARYTELYNERLDKIRQLKKTNPDPNVLHFESIKNSKEIVDMLSKEFNFDFKVFY